MSYTNQRVASVPWSIHIVRVERTNRHYELRSAHAGGKALGLTTLSAQLPRGTASREESVAAINGDFYQRDRTYAGDPRGLQIIDGDVVSAPSGGAAFWIDAQGEPHVGEVVSRFEVVWPGGRKTSFGVNSERPPGGVMLYTPAAGPTTRTSGGREIVLENPAAKKGPSLRIGAVVTTRVVEVRDEGSTPLAPGTLVLSVGSGLAKSLPKLEPGTEVVLSTATFPQLTGARTAIGGGPVLLTGGRRQRISANGDGFESSSMFERHPRSAIGWNASTWFLVEVDGRQRGLSVGMTLEELGTFMAKLGCQEAMNLDGGGSATLWYGGRVRNSPCDGHERAIANSLVVVRKTLETAAGTGTKSP